MSNPPNPLARFQTYSYHHLLAVCDSTETAEALASPTTDLSRFQNRSDNPETRNVNERVQNLEAVTRTKFGEENDGNYIVLMNGTTDAQFIITKASWTSLLAPQQNTPNGGAEISSMEFDGELEIIEPLGARFMRVVADATKSLNRDPVGLTWVLRTIFVGQLPGGRVETISNIKGVMFMVTDIEATFDESGSVYNVKWIGSVNGVGHMPALQQIARGQYVPVTKDISVKKALENYADILNQAWLDQKERLKEQAAAVSAFGDGNAFDDVDFDKDFIKVEYKIEVDSDFDDFPAGTNEQIATQNKGDGDTVIAPGEVVSVDAMIKRILDSSEEIQQLVEGKHVKNLEGVEAKTVNGISVPKKPKRYVYKILSGLTSTPNLYTITYFVKLFEMPTTPFNDLFGKGFVPAPGQFLEFDYIFTGKNTDILEFDMTMQMGLAFLQVISSTNNSASQAEYANQEVANCITPTTAASRASTESKRKTKTPLFLGMKLTDPIFRHKKNTCSTLNFQTMFGRWAGLENMEAKIKITGNSQLLSDSSAFPSELGLDSTTTPIQSLESGQVDTFQELGPQPPGQVSASQQAQRTVESTVAPSWTTRPVLMKINIKFPSTSEQDRGAFESFWWDGFYYMFSVSHTFEDGQFTQEIEMFSLIQDDGLFETSGEELDPATPRLTPLQAAAASVDVTDGPPVDPVVVTEIPGGDVEEEQVFLPSGDSISRELDELPDFQRPTNRQRLGTSGASRELTKRPFAESVKAREIRRSRLRNEARERFDASTAAQGAEGDIGSIT